MKHYLKTYPVTLFCIALIWYLCLFTPPKTRLSEVPFFDKWVHISMYLGTCSVLWCEYLRSRRQTSTWRLLTGTIVLPVLMSGCIELVQAYCTTTRSGDWLDFAANSLGVLLAALLGKTIYPNLLRKTGLLK